MKTVSKILLGVAVTFFVGSAAFAQETQQEDRQSDTYDTQTETDDQNTYDTDTESSGTAGEYDPEAETYDTETQDESMDTETDDTYDTQTEGTETYEESDETLTGERDTLGTRSTYDPQTQDQGIQGHEMQAQDFTSYDADMDGRISEEEFKTSFTQNYSAWDTNQDGTLDENEFNTGREGTGQEGVADQYGQESEMTTEGENKEFVSSIFESIDEDSDGYLDQQEFESWTSDTQGKK